MIRVYSTPDGRACCISFDENAPDPQPPLELVRSYSDQEREEAWALLHELGGQPTLTSSRGRSRSGAGRARWESPTGPES